MIETNNLGPAANPRSQLIQHKNQNHVDRLHFYLNFKVSSHYQIIVATSAKKMFLVLERKNFN